MTSISFSNDHLIVNVEGLDKLLAFKGEIKINLAHIKSVEVNHQGLMDFKHATFGIGTIFANKIQTGTFKENGEKSLCDVHDIKNNLTKHNRRLISQDYY